MTMTEGTIETKSKGKTKERHVVTLVGKAAYDVGSLMTRAK